MISLSFDDGHKDHIDVAFPILKKYDFCSTFYVSSGKIGKKNYMSKEDLITLEKNNNEVGSHCINHPNLVFCLPKKIKKEVVDSKKYLISLGLHISTFCYPYGFYNNYIINKVKEANYIGARIFNSFLKFKSPYNNKNTDVFKLKTISITNNIKKKDIENYIMSLKNDEWLILTFHHIKDNPSHWDCTKEMLEFICDCLKGHKHEIVTINNGIRKLYL